MLCVSEILEYCATAPQILGYWKYCEILQLSLPTQRSHNQGERAPVLPGMEVGVTQCHRPRPGGRERGRRRRSQRDRAERTKRRRGRGQRRLGGEVGPHSRRVTIGRRTGGRTEGREGPPRRGVRRPCAERGVPSGDVSEECVCCRASVWCLLAPSRGGVPLLGETRSAELTLGDPCLL